MNDARRPAAELGAPRRPFFQTEASVVVSVSACVGRRASPVSSGGVMSAVSLS
ncbi:hypothetical protein F01_400043 [Burkholderia cenocepacia]|nr:hypothetical protein F01_400043 [Burkholderia cenocepacia]